MLPLYDITFTKREIFQILPPNLIIFLKMALLWGRSVLESFICKALGCATPQSKNLCNHTVLVKNSFQLLPSIMSRVHQ